MSWRTDAPFKRGETQFNGGAINTPASGDLMSGFNYEGQEYEWEDCQLPNGGYGTGLTVRTRVVRNSATYNILPGQLCIFGATRYGDNSAVLLGTNVSGLAATEAAYCFPADEFLPPGGVPPGDLFYIVIHGPCLMTTAKTVTGTETTNIAVGQKVVSATGAATTDGNQGAVIAQDLSAVTTAPETTISGQINNAIGRAMSATTTNQTGTSILVAVGW